MDKVVADIYRDASRVAAHAFFGASLHSPVAIEFSTELDSDRDELATEAIMTLSGKQYSHVCWTKINGDWRNAAAQNGRALAEWAYLYPTIDGPVTDIR